MGERTGMKRWSNILFFIMTAMLLVSIVVTRTPARSDTHTTVDHRLYGALLKKYVHHGVVNYQGFKNEEKLLDHYLKVLENTETKILSRHEQFAFYINAYNAWTIKFILSGYPGITSIKDLGSIFRSPWKKKICRIDGTVITLDDIEHEILRPRFEDPRVHFAINCASKGCPPLISEPYNGSILDRQLDESTAAFLNNSERNRLDGNVLYVSKIFKWFPKDFRNDVVGFFMKYVTEDIRTRLEQTRGNIAIDYLDYDWSLNGY